MPMRDTYFLLAVTILLGGCTLPIHPGVHGRVFDLKTRQVIAGVEISRPCNKPTVFTHTDRNGEFLLPPEQVNGFFPMTTMHYNSDIRIVAVGVEDCCLDIRLTRFQDAMLSLGDIGLIGELNTNLANGIHRCRSRSLE